MPIPSVVTQHAEEAAFLWLLRDGAVRAPHYTLADLAALDNRVEGHLDGLRIAGAAGWEACEQELKWEEAGEVFTAAVLALGSGEGAWVDTVLEAGSAGREQACGLVSALGWMPFAQARPFVDWLLGSESAVLRRCGLAAAAAHRYDPGTPLEEALEDEDATLRARALRSVGELGRVDLRGWLRAAQQADDPACRFWAAWSAVLLGETGGADLLRVIAEEGGAHAERACRTAMQSLPFGAARSWHGALAESDSHRRLAVVGAGALGDSDLVPWLFDAMADPALARAAGEAVTSITGLDLAYHDFDAAPPDGFAPVPTEDPDDDRVAVDPDEDLPWPDVQRLRAWWATSVHRYAPGVRYLCGSPVGAETARRVLGTGTQRQRTAAAEELALLEPGATLFEVRAPGFRQQTLLQAHAAVGL